MIKIIHILLLLAILVGLGSCYKEEHFSIPGPYWDDTPIPDTLPFPFDSTRMTGEYLIKDGKVDFSKITTNGYSDFVPAMGDTLSWFQGDGFYGSVQHYNFYPLNTQDHLGRNANSYQNVGFGTRTFLETGPGKQFYVYAKMSFTYLKGTAPWFWFGAGELGNGFTKRTIAGFDGGSGFNGFPIFFANFSGTLVNSTTAWPNCIELYGPDEPFEMEIVVVDYFAYFKINGRTVWVYNLEHTNNAVPLYMVPWRNSVKFYDLYIEGDTHELPMATWQNEKAYAGAQDDQVYVNSQVPSLVQAANGDVLLLAEGHAKSRVLVADQAKAAIRSNSSAIVMKRSQDGGITWSDLTTIVGGPDQASVNLKPVTVRDINGGIHLFYTVDNTGYLGGSYSIFHKVSSDNGHSWSEPVEIFVPLTDYTVTTLSGHGLRTSAGRLVIPLSCVKSDQNTVATLYSDDEGASWQCGAVVPNKDVRGANLVELSDSRLMLILSHNAVETPITAKRKISYSTDGGITWAATVYSNGLSYPDGVGGYGYRWPGCAVKTADGKLVHFTPLGQSGSDFNSDPYKVNNPPTVGKGIYVTTSTDEGQTWSARQNMFTLQTYNGYNFYSGNMDAICLDDGSILCVTEGGVKIATEGLVAFKK